MPVTGGAVGTAMQKPTTGRGGNANFPSSRAGLIQTEEDRELIKTLVGEVLLEYRRPVVKNDQELAERFDDYFRRCAVRGQVPTIEEMYLSTGLVFEWLADCEHGKTRGFSDKTSQIIKKAKSFMRSIDAKLVTSGKLNFLTYCFRSKNYYGMSDKTEVTISAGVPQEETMSAEEIAARYGSGDEIETTFVDDQTPGDLDV